MIDPINQNPDSYGEFPPKNKEVAAWSADAERIATLAGTTRSNHRFSASSQASNAHELFDVVPGLLQHINARLPNM